MLLLLVACHQKIDLDSSMQGDTAIEVIPGYEEVPGDTGCVASISELIVVDHHLTLGSCSGAETEQDYYDPVVITACAGDYTLVYRELGEDDAGTLTPCHMSAETVDPSEGFEGNVHEWEQGISVSSGGLLVAWVEVPNSFVVASCGEPSCSGEFYFRVYRE